MSDLPSMPLFVDDYEAATAHLTMEEDGAYMRLLRLCWRTPGCSIPDDDAWIMRRMRVDADTFSRVVAPLIDEFFERKQGRIFQKRQRKEYDYVTRLVHKRKIAGKRGGEAKARKMQQKAPNKATDLPEQKSSNALAPTPTPTPSKKRDTNVSPKKGSRLPEDWRLPKDWGQWAVDQGMDELAVRREAEKFRDWWIAQPGQKAVKVDWQATWRNWIRKALDDRPKRRATVQQGGRRGEMTALGFIPEDD